MTHREEIIDRIVNLDDDELAELMVPRYCPDGVGCTSFKPHYDCTACWCGYLAETDKEAGDRWER